ncbi:hypothetical protein E2320_017992 [Naja naja]|nr:hypothetical protein E2320_017992 [Naja naja]
MAALVRLLALQSGMIEEKGRPLPFPAGPSVPLVCSPPTSALCCSSAWQQAWQQPSPGCSSACSLVAAAAPIAPKYLGTWAWLPTSCQVAPRLLPVWLESGINVSRHSASLPTHTHQGGRKEAAAFHAFHGLGLRDLLWQQEGFCISPLSVAPSSCFLCPGPAQDFAMPRRSPRPLPCMSCPRHGCVSVFVCGDH